MGREIASSTTSKENYQTRIGTVTTAGELLPGLKDKLGLSKEIIRIERTWDSQSGRQRYALSMEKLFGVEDILLLLTAHSSTGGGFEVSEAGRSVKESLKFGYSLFSEREKLSRALVADPLEEFAGRLMTETQARDDFLYNRRNGREYKKLYKKQDSERNISRIVADLADLMKEKPYLWKSKNVQGASDQRAISRFAQLDLRVRSLFLKEYLESQSQDKQDQIINDHMKAVYDASPLYIVGEDKNESIGFLAANQNEERFSGNLSVDRDIDVITLHTDQTNLLIPVLAWSREVNGRAADLTNVTSDTIKLAKVSQNNSQVLLSYTLNHRNYSSLLGLLILDYFAEQRNNSQDNIDPGFVIQRAIGRESILVNSEMIRNAEGRLAA